MGKLICMLMEVKTWKGLRVLDVNTCNITMVSLVARVRCVKDAGWTGRDNNTARSMQQWSSIKCFIEMCCWM